MKIDESNNMTISSGDEVVFKGIYYQVPDWYDDQPVVFTKPFLYYSEGNWESILDDICIDLCVNDGFQIDDESIVEDDIRWSGKSSNSIKRAISKALKTGKSAYSSVYNEVFECKVRFYEEPENPDKPYDEEDNPMEMKYEIVERKVVN